MIIYKVSQNYQKGIQEYEVDSINEDGTFNYLHPFYKKQFIKPLIPDVKIKCNQPSYFITKSEARIYLSERLQEKINEFQNHIDVCKAVLNAI